MTNDSFNSREEWMSLSVFVRIASWRIASSWMMELISSICALPMCAIMWDIWYFGLSFVSIGGGLLAFVSVSVGVVVVGTCGAGVSVGKGLGGGSLRFTNDGGGIPKALKRASLGVSDSDGANCTFFKGL